MKEPTLKQNKQFNQLVEDQGLSCDELQSTYDTGAISRVLRAAKLDTLKDVDWIAVDRLLGLQPKDGEAMSEFIESVHTVTVNYGQPLGEMVRAGHYDYVNSDITEQNFSLSGEGALETAVALFHFNRSMSSDEVIEEMRTAGYRPARIEELLALGAQEPELQRQFPIVALGSTWRDRYGGVYVPYFSRWCVERELYLDWFGSRWYARCRFVGVRA